MKVNLERQVIDNPRLPAGPLVGYSGSSVLAELVGIPDTICGCTVAGVSVTLTTPDGIPVTAPAEKVGSEWHVQFASSNFTSYGVTRKGFKTTATLRKDDGTTFQYTIAIGNLQIDAGTTDAQPGDPSRGFVSKGSDIFVKSQIVGGVQHFVKQTMEYIEDMNAWGANWTGDYILEAGEFIPYEAPTGGGIATAAVALALLLAPFLGSAVTATKEYVDRKDGEVAAAATNYTDQAVLGLVPYRQDDKIGARGFVVDWGYGGYIEFLGESIHFYHPPIHGVSGVDKTITIPVADGAFALTNDLATLSDSISTLSDEIAPAVSAYPRIYAFMTGSTNANFVVTNYQLTAEADASRTHFDPADPDLDFSTVPSSLRLEDFSTGTNRVVVDTRDWTVWYFAQKIGSAIHTAYTNAVETCRAWVNFTATGLENPVPDTLIVDVPNIWLMAGKTFEKHVAGSNACWVIRSKDAVVPISDNAQSAGGFLELTDVFGEPYIRFNKTESYFVDPAASGIWYNAGAWEISYETQSQPKGGANAVIEGSTTYPGKAVLKDEDDPDCPATITWTGSAGNWVMHAVPKSVGGVVPTSMFFGAVVEVQGQDFIEYLRPMSIPHLLVDGVKIAPDIPASHPTGTTITWKVVE